MPANGLPHYKNSTAAMNNWEPVFTDLFQIRITPPPAIGGNWDLIIENIKRLGGLDIDKMPDVVDQSYKGHKRRYIGVIPGETTLNLSIDFEVNLNDQNQMYVYNELRKWCDLAYNPLTGRSGLKRNYVAGPMVVSLFNKAGDVFKEYTFNTVFPISQLPAIDLEYGGNAIYSIDGFELAADFWDVVDKK